MVEYSKSLIIGILNYYHEFYNRCFLTKYPDMVVLKADIDIALNKLNKELRNVIVEYYCKGVNNDKAVANKLGIPTRTVAYRRSRGIEELYKILNNL